MQSKVTSLEQSLALAEFTVNLMEDKRGKDEELAQLKRKFETEIETYKQLLGIFYNNLYIIYYSERTLFHFVKKRFNEVKYKLKLNWRKSGKKKALLVNNWKKQSI